MNRKILGLIVFFVVIVAIAGGIFWWKEGSPKQNFNNIVCDHNFYNCSNFSSYKEAQVIFNFCGGKENDTHKLDGDKDGRACEYLL